ncbi:MAG TPA: serine/threonine-protein kinase [Thermoanaerobaculia bacterium]
MNPGDLLDGRYQITARLGAGGMGEVYKATHAFLGSPRVIKVVHPNIVSNTDVQERFLREARIATRIQHTNVATLHDFASLPDGAHYMVWEFIEGENLAQRLRTTGNIAPRKAIAIAIQALHGLEAIHRAGIVHRDISPENLMITPRDEVKIIDLGVAKFDDPEAVSSTRTGIFVGKLRYAAPEQLGFLPDGEKIDGRADIYALAMVVFELLTGRPPYEAKSPHEYFMHHAREVQQANVILPVTFPCREELQAVIEKALSRNRNDRFATPSEFAAALEAIERLLPGELETPTVAMPLGAGEVDLTTRTESATATPSNAAMTAAMTAPAVTVQETADPVPELVVPAPAAETLRTPLPVPAPARSRAVLWVALILIAGFVAIAAGAAFALRPQLTSVLASLGLIDAPATSQASLQTPVPSRPAEAVVEVTEPQAAAVVENAAETTASAAPAPAAVIPAPTATATPLTPAPRKERERVTPEPEESEPPPVRRVAVYVDGPGRNAGNDRALAVLRQELRGVREVALRAGGMQVDVYRAINRYLPDLSFEGEADVVIQFDATNERLRRQGQHLAAAATIEKNGRVIFRYELPSYVDRSAAAEAFAQTLSDAFVD